VDPQEKERTDLTSLNRIRVETALSRFPIHRLAKKGNISIDLSSDTSFQWKVSYNSEYGQPGPHAYKVDTLVVNRRIDEAQRPLPEVIRLGSLREINRDLALSEEDTNTVKKALLQNASAFISAKIRYKPKNAKNGQERWGEIHYTRYSVVFTGETLPDGRPADAVYIVLNPPHRKMLNEAEVRPLDYDYLTELNAGPQRLYELLSFQIYGAIASGRPRAKLLYSEYCMCAPQVRYLTFNGVKKQMYKIHLPHRESGYITKVDYLQSTDKSGQLDWEMLYTPGPKAVDEYHAFTHRQIRQQAHVSGATPSSKSKEPPVQESFDLSDAGSHLASEITRRGISEKMARDLAANLKPGQELMDQLEYYDHLKAADTRGKIASPTGLLVSIVRDNTAVPEDFPTSRKRRLQNEAQQAEIAARDQHTRLELSYEEYQTAEVNRYINEVLSPEDVRLIFEQIRLSQKRAFKQMTPAQLDELARRKLHVEVRQSGRVPMVSFEEFCRQRTVVEV